jgi:hypothetical protein
MELMGFRVLRALKEVRVSGDSKGRRGMMAFKGYRACRALKEAKAYKAGKGSKVCKA